MFFWWSYIFVVEHKMNLSLGIIQWMPGTTNSLTCCDEPSVNERRVGNGPDFRRYRVGVACLSAKPWTG